MILRSHPGGRKSKQGSCPAGWKANDLFLIPKRVLGDANLVVVVFFIQQDAEEILVLCRARGKPNFIDMWQYRLLILDVHPLFFTVAVNLLVTELSNIHNAAFLFLLEGYMFHQVLQGEKGKPDGLKNFLFFVFIAFIV